ncbi:MAG: hypothetical protein Q7R70_02445 [Candidatus Diapherotrites archaeon]|nr:hypothetical protein [Candidatus Diapherotrites archaeon]
MPIFKKARKTISLRILKASRKKTSPMLARARSLKKEARNAKANARLAFQIGQGYDSTIQDYGRTMPKAGFVQDARARLREMNSRQGNNERVFREKINAADFLKAQALQKRARAKRAAKFIAGKR